MDDTEVKDLKQIIESGSVSTFKKTYFVMAENSFLRNPAYSINIKMIYMLLCSYAGAISSCYPSKETIAKDLNISVRTVYSVLKELEELGAVIIINQITESNRKSSNFYILCEVNKDTGEFMTDSIHKFKVLTNEPIRIRGK